MIMDLIYKIEDYLKKVISFYNDNMIKVITGIRRCGKSSLLKSIIEELKEKGIKEKDIIYIELDKKEYKNIKNPKQLEKLIDSLIVDNDFKYLFIDEVQNVKGFETVVNAYREEGNFSIFLTGSNSYLLSGELITKLTGRYIEFEMLPLNFCEYVLMKKFLNKDVNDNIYKEFEEYARCGGFPGSLYYDNYEDKMLYTKNVINQIFENDIKINKKIKDKNIKVDRRTINGYIDVLKQAKIIYACDMFDIKSKDVLDCEKKYYLADTSLYFMLNTDNRINYGPVLENILFSYFKSKGYLLSVGKIGKLEIDFIVRKGIDNYYYVQVSKNIDDDSTKEREYKPFYAIKEMYPRYLFVLDLIFQENIDGIKNINIVDFIYNNEELV